VSARRAESYGANDGFVVGSRRAESYGANDGFVAGEEPETAAPSADSA
jgi:hypothetical protein